MISVNSAEASGASMVRIPLDAMGILRSLHLD